MHSRIIKQLSPKVGAEAAEIAYSIVVNRLWISLMSLVSLAFIGLAIKLGDWLFGGLAIATYGVMICLIIRMFILRRRYFSAASSMLGFRVDWRHPPRGVPNWRRQLDESELAKLDDIYERWYVARSSNT